MNRKNRRRENGSAYVEAIFVIPVLWLLIAVLVDGTLLIHDWMMANHAARIAARQASLFVDPCDPGTQETNAKDLAEGWLDPQLRGSELNAGGVTIDHAEEGTGSTLCNSGLLLATVPIQYDHFLLPPLAPTLLVTGRASAMNENDN